VRKAASASGSTPTLPAVAAGVTDRVWNVTELIPLLDAASASRQAMTRTKIRVLNATIPGFQTQQMARALTNLLPHARKKPFRTGIASPT